MTAYNSTKSTMTISGTTYTMAETADIGTLDLKVGASELTGIAAKKDATFYVDANGYVVAAEAVSAEVTHAVVDKIAKVRTGGTGSTTSLRPSWCSPTAPPRLLRSPRSTALRLPTPATVTAS